MTYRKRILQIALPAMAENVLQMLMGVIDNYFVAHISLAAVSGVAIANNIITLYQALFIAMGSAISSLLARSIGQGDEGRELKYMADAIMLTLLLSIFIGLLNLVFGRPILVALGARSQVLGNGYSYLLVVGGLMVALAMLTTLGAIVRVKGLAKIPMHVSLLTTILNVLMSGLSIYVFDLGVLGVAWSTVLSRWIGIMILASFLPMRAIIRKMKVRLNLEMLSLALPAAGERIMMRLGDLFILMIVVHLGTRIVAGNAIGESISQFNYMPGMAVATATLIPIAQFLGSQKDDDIEPFVKEAFKLSTIIMVIFSLFMFLLSSTLVAYFTEDKIASNAARVVLFFSMISAPATSGTLVYTAVWQGLGNSKLPFYATTIGMWFVRILLGYFLAIQLRLGLEGVWLATAMDNSSRWFILKRQFDKREKFQAN
ncbi:MATE family efflux transporter [Streptococcus uberis]|uniref:MATE family efflux transporter n=1 Tax=Streptococcus uberis TaxID=1349 RepID=UPI00214F9FD5|nr:MATE family efflux transporter [Streptococcus uberis]MCR4254172.1 MATE family efflux transporter [Streptococcus uberis]MCR4255989.1 MATE family efflux transporter [Streptococcus uberis]MCR4260663.1 MATE family efflux transporter [Streptococcus uberis]MCR4263030.1 MATE family efflux transporter [Streptococcus uberis]MCV6816697.1 MATE family efflux transporter [Streptococcus uberis]